MPYISVAFGGALGALLRFIITKHTISLALGFPLGTLLSNIIAGFVCGFVLSLYKSSLALSPNALLFLTTGMMGGLSTFSTFSWETVDYLKNSKYFLAGLNTLLNLILSLGAVIVGMALADRIR